MVSCRRIAVAHFQLGADAVGPGNQDGVPIARRLEVEQGAESAEPGHGAGPAGGLGGGPDGADQIIGGIHVDAGILISSG